MLVTIERVERKQGKNGSYHLVHLGEGRKVYCWDWKLAQELMPGAVYEVEVKDGQFPRLLAARQVTSLDGAQGQERAEPPVPVQASSHERLEALRVVLTLAQWTRLESVDQALAAADKVLQWLKGEGGQG
jgi:hypothetical protein